jgi:hypothetical protein
VTVAGRSPRRLPALIAHADWSTDPRKRWITVARRDGERYRLGEPEAVGEVPSLLERLAEQAPGGPVVAGFDFPIGVPIAYARRAGIDRFLDALPRFGTGPWEAFYDIAGTPDEIGARRPFYPAGRGGTSQAHLVAGLGVTDMRDLLRECDRGGAGQRTACCVFWTLGGQQVGRAAIAGWRGLLAPALAAAAGEVGIWPFQGSLDHLLARRRVVVVESYPAEACVHLGLTAPGWGWSKQCRADRRARAAALRGWAARRDAVLARRLLAEIDDGFGPGDGGDDRFDSVVGVMSMIDVILGHRPEGAPARSSVRAIEGWIFGRADPTSRPVASYDKLPAGRRAGSGLGDRRRPARPGGPRARTTAARPTRAQRGDRAWHSRRPSSTST